MLFDVSPNVFYPRPNVTSTLVRLTMRATPRAAVADEAFFRSMVRGVFGKRRKTLRNSLRYFLGEPPPCRVLRSSWSDGPRISQLKSLPI